VDETIERTLGRCDHRTGAQETTDACEASHTANVTADPPTSRRREGGTANGWDINRIRGERAHPKTPRPPAERHAYDALKALHVKSRLCGDLL